jgi:serine/threonine protein kinase
MFAVGDVLDTRYKMVGRLGSGGMGEVYRATRLLLGDDVAIKVIRPAGEQANVMRERFLRESRAIARLRHPNIVSLLDFAIDPEGRPYLVMEHLNGPSLGEELRARGTFDVASFRRILGSICGALQLAHDRGIVHRDLKPPNIVSHRFDTGEIVWKIIDFGLVNIAGGTDTDTPLTEKNTFLGTAAYAAPEQLIDGSLDGRTDLYSLGVIAFEMLSGRRPFEADSLMGLLDQHLRAAPPDLSALRPDLPPELTRAVMRALAKDPDARWSSASAFSRAILTEDLPTVAISTAAEVPSGLLATYELGPVIGRGRFGSEIHHGMHRALGHPVAIRTFRPTAQMDRDAVRTRFLKEARALQVAHPNIVQVRDFGEAGDTLYVVTDLLEGTSLAERLRGGPLPPPALRDFVTQLIDATRAVHRHQGVICGVHPDIMRIVTDDEGERLAISSAGICSLRDLLATLDEHALRGHALTGTELPYVAPELLMGKAATPRADLFTIGVLGYQMAAGRLPFEAPSLPELLGVMMAGVQQPLAAARPDLPADAASCLTACLAFDAAQRPASASALLKTWRAAWATLPTDAV